MSSDTCSRSSGSPCSSPTPTPAKPTNKRCNKPQMERKRRERINCSLNVLKQLVLDALKKDTSQYSKLEKADILEMTVKHLRDLQRRQLLTAANNDVTVVGKYRAGFTECATEVSRYLSSVDGLRSDVRDRLMGHLSSCVQRVSSPPTMHDAQIQQQRHVAMTSPHMTMTSPQQQMITSQLMTSQAATRPIQIQIPMATPPGSLPGAGIQTLQLATSAHSDAGSMTSSRASSCSPPQHNASYSPVTSPQAYIGAFQVIPNGQIPAYLLQQNGRQQEVNISASGTPLYVSTSSLQQVAAHIQQQLPHSALPSSGIAMKRPAQEVVTEAPPMKKMMGHCYGVQNAARLAINETLRDEKVWRPW